MRIAVCMTSHNRREKTLAALDSLAKQRVPLNVILVDAGSTDGTAEAVRVNFPDVRVLPAGPELYWSSGTRRAMQEAVSEQVDAVLWLNDDTVLRPGALSAMCMAYDEAVHEDPSRPHVVVGTTASPDTSQVTYGGWATGPWWRPLRLSRVVPGLRTVPCDTFNGNAVLIPADALSRVGLVDDCWVHGGGDIDYGLRLSRSGVGVWVCPDVVGECALNNIQRTWQDASLPLGERLRHMTDVKSLPPTQHYLLCRRWGGPFWPVALVSPYLRLVVSALTQRTPTWRAVRRRLGASRDGWRSPSSPRQKRGSA